MMFRNFEPKKAAELIWNSWENGNLIDKLPSKFVPKTKLEAYNVQQVYESFSKSPLFGWKIAATSKAGQSHIGVKNPLIGRILKEKVFVHNTTIKNSKNNMSVAEPEIAFRFKNDLFPKKESYTDDEILQAVGTMHPAIELPDSRFKNFSNVGEFILIADNACAHQFIIGPKMSEEWRVTNLSELKISIRSSNGSVNRGSGSNVLGSPYLALNWLVNELSKNNITIKKGQYVSTGTCAKPLNFSPGDKITADYGKLGQIYTEIDNK